MLFWRLYGGRKFTGEYIGGKFVFKSWSNFTYRGGIHPGRPASEMLHSPSPYANVSEGDITIYTRRNMAITNEKGEGDYVKWEGRWYRINEEKRHGILLPHNRYIAVLADLPLAGLDNTVDVFATIYGQGEVTGTGSFEVGTEITLKAIPAKGWEFSHWFRGDEEDITIETNTYTLNVPERGLVIECHFKEIPNNVADNDIEILSEEGFGLLSENDEIITSG